MMTRWKAVACAASLVAAGCGGGASPADTDADDTGSATLAVVSGPDLVVSAVSAPPSVVPNGAFTTTVTVCNQGTAPSAPTSLAVRLSTDTVINSADFLAGMGPVGPLLPGQCSAVGARCSATLSAGTYHVGAVADPSNTVIELSETNNTLAGNLVGIGSKPDLVISAVSGPAFALPGAPITASLTICNQGTLPSIVVLADVRLSTDTVIDISDYLVGGTGSGTLNPGQCAPLSVSGNAPTATGTYSLGAIADPTNRVAELIETNNTAVAGGAFVVDNRPDLVVSAVTGPALVAPGTPFDVSVTVCNQGTATNAGIDVDVRLSTDAIITPSDPVVGGAPVGPLAPGECTTVDAKIVTSAPLGAYFLGAIVDPSNGVTEIDETNNVAAGNAVAVTDLPDLVEAVVFGPSVASPGDPITVTVTVCNQSTAPSAATSVDVRLSTDASIGPEDLTIGSAAIAPLSAWECQMVDVAAIASAPVGAYYLGAVVDPASGLPELDESNNTLAGNMIGVGVGPDLAVTAVSGPASAAYGSIFTTTVTVCNQGPLPTLRALVVQVQLSADTTLTSDDPIVGGADGPTLAPGQCVDVAVPSGAYVGNGSYFPGATVSLYDDTSELNTTNNSALGGAIVVGP
jgi:subtilase family serine protease